MKTRSAPAWIVAVLLIAAACGGGDTSGPGDGDGDATPPEGATPTTASPDDGDSNDGGTSAQTGTSQPGDTTETSQPDNGTAPPGGGAEANRQAIISPPPDPEDMTPTDEGPDHTWMLFRAYATVTAGGNTVDFVGFDPIWSTDFNPAGAPLMDLLEVDPERDVVLFRQLTTVAGCSVLQTSDGLVIAQASFHHATERNLHSSFSMSDNGDGTVTWGLYNAESGEEWSATGPGAASVRYVRHQDLVGLAYYGIERESDNIYIIIDFEGPASENFTTDKSQASSRVLCRFVQRP